MALKSNNTSLAVGAPTFTAQNFVEPTKPGDLMLISDLSFDIQGVTVENNEYTGSPFKNAPDVSGKRVTFSFNVKLRPPGGSDVPAANAWLPGRLLQTAKMAEVRTTTAIPSSPEAVGGASTDTVAVLGTGAAATANLYKGLALLLSDNGPTYKRQLTAIRSYNASKEAALMEELGAPPAANYQIPKQLSYMRSVDSTTPPYVPLEVWIDGDHFQLVDCRLTGLQLVVPTTTKSQAAYAEFRMTVDATIHAHDEEATPSITPLPAPPLFRDGDAWLNRVAIGLTTFTIDLGLQTEGPPNPNYVDGEEPPELAGGVSTVSMTRQRYKKNTLDTLGIADAQTQVPFFAQWGNGAAAMIQIVIPDARLNHPSPDLSGLTVNETGDLLLDVFDRGLCINFPY